MFGAALLVAASGVALAPVPASAQTTGEIPYVDAVDAWADGQSLRRTLPGSGDGTITTPPKSRRVKRPTAQQLASLRFERRDEITARNDQAVMALLEPGYDPAAVVAEFDRLRGTRARRHQGLEGTLESEQHR